MQETQIRFLGWEDTLEEEMATHSKYCLENPMNREPWQSMGLQRVGCDLAMEHACTSYFNQDFQVWLIIKSRHIQKCHAMQKTGMYYNPCHHNSQNGNLFTCDCCKNYVGKRTVDRNLLNNIIISS